MAIIALTGLRTPCVLIVPGRLETAGAIVGGNGSSIQMRGAGRGQGRRSGRGWR
jgi:hypothetical protein